MNSVRLTALFPAELSAVQKDPHSAVLSASRKAAKMAHKLAERKETQSVAHWGLSWAEQMELWWAAWLAETLAGMMGSL